MQRWYQCVNCHAPVAYGARFCGNCGKSLNWGTQPQVQQSVYNEQEGPSMHIAPLNPKTKEPVLFYVGNTLTLPAVTTNGRLSYLIGTANLVKEIHNRIKERYPKKQYSGVQSYVMCAVMLKPLGEPSAALIFEIWGFWEQFRELDDLYNTLYSLGDVTVGDARYNQIIQYLANDPVKTWIDTLIAFLKKQLQWSDYVDRALKRLFPQI